MAGSWFKRAHRTHGLDQPAGEPYPHLVATQAARRSGVDARVWAMFEELCARVPDPAKRAELLGVPPLLEAAWTRGAGAPMLRAHRKALERALRGA